MSKVALVVVLALVGCALAINEAEREFADFKQTYGRTYSGAQEAHAFDCFKMNLKLIAERNAQNPHATHSINQFADLCPAEFAKMYLGTRPNNGTRTNVKKLSEKDISKVGACTSVDWRSAGVVTPVKNQGQCGSCWAFSSTGNMEGQWAHTGHGLVSLSEEELVQCSSSDGNMGCNGGLMDQAFEWVIQNGGINSEANYPYTSGGGITGSCNGALLSTKVAAISSYIDLPNSEQSMAAWVCTGGPLAIGVYAESWQTYSGGIVTNCGGTQMDHGVLIVGFNENNNPPYWIVKNSWGAAWGENGYIRLEMFQDECGINQYPTSSQV